jgi:15-cis-phytoene synthase
VPIVTKAAYAGTATARREAARIIAKGSKSFALASRILPPQARIDASLVYAWCRYVDDCVDASLPSTRATALARLREELAALYDDRPLSNPLWEALREVLRRRRIPQAHFDTLLDGMQMDVDGVLYETLDDLRLYCHRVAGVVGWLMAGVLGVSDAKALRPAAHLGIAMQLTNICRDVKEDWDNRRLYLPNGLLTGHGYGNLHHELGGPLPNQACPAIAATVSDLLSVADSLYASGDDGLAALSARSAFAVRTARLVYSAIGKRVRETGCDVHKGRAIVPLRRKLLLLLEAGATTLLALPERARQPHVEVALKQVPTYPDDLLPW